MSAAEIMDATAAYRCCLNAACGVLRVDRHFVAKLNPRTQGRGARATRQERLGILARRFAFYVLHRTLNVKQAACGRAAGVTRQAICIAVREAELMRDNPAIDLLLAEISVKALLLAKGAAIVDGPNAYGKCLAVTCEVMGLDRRMVEKLDPALQGRGSRATKDERLGALARRIAIYVLNCELGVPQAAVARAGSVERATVCIAARDIEDLRDDEYCEAMISKISEQVTSKYSGLVGRADKEIAA